MSENVDKNVINFEAWKLKIQASKVGKVKQAYEQELLKEFQYVTSDKRRALLIATAKHFAWLDFLDDEKLNPHNDKID